MSRCYFSRPIRHSRDSFSYGNTRLGTEPINLKRELIGGTVVLLMVGVLLFLAAGMF